MAHGELTLFPRVGAANGRPGDGGGSGADWVGSQCFMFVLTTRLLLQLLL